MPCDVCGICRATTKSGDWQVCDRHRVMLRPAKFDSPCMACGEPMAAGTNVYLAKEGERWFAWHMRCPVVEPGEPPLSPQERAREILCVTTAAPREVLLAAHKALSLVHHPDRGGSLQRMQDINHALDVALGRSRR